MGARMCWCHPLPGHTHPPPGHGLVIAHPHCKVQCVTIVLLPYRQPQGHANPPPPEMRQREGMTADTTAGYLLTLAQRAGQAFHGVGQK